jgi:hypothetical protein
VTNRSGNRREWVPSSIKEIDQPCFSIPHRRYLSIEERPIRKTIAFKTGSHLDQIKESALGRSELKSIVILVSLIVLCTYCLSSCLHLESVTFEVSPKLKPINKSALPSPRLTYIGIPSGVTMIEKECFFECSSLLTRVIHFSEQSFDVTTNSGTAVKSRM